MCHHYFARQREATTHLEGAVERRMEPTICGKRRRGHAEEALPVLVESWDCGSREWTPVAELH